MHMTKVPGLLLVLLCCELCLTIKVPVTWAESAISEVKNERLEATPNNEQVFNPHNVQVIRTSANQQQIPNEYFEYTAQKPKFAADIAAFHGVQNPEQQYKAHPVRPHTGKQKPALGIHEMLNGDKEIYQPLQKYVQHNENLNSYVKPTSSNYEIFHPYRAEEPALQEIYKDPVLTKIRNDLHDSKNRLQAYEQQAGELNIEKDEYLENPEKTDAKLFPHRNVPARYEIHKPERQPIYYRVPPRNAHRDHVLNKKIKHPWNQGIKVKPMHYRPLHNHIHRLRQQHAIKYDDERNEYPQVPQTEGIGEPEDGYDIYEKGQQKYTQLRNNLDESVNQIVQQNGPATYKKLELQQQQPEDENDDDKEEFVPIKNYAQVRKTETFKHLPKKAAFDDAETYEEIINAPRLREAVKSTKAQVVYSEEGYEDSAYDHAGEQKHASDHEGHGGFLKQHEISGRLYKIPTVSGKYQDGKGSQYRDNTEHGKKWEDSKKNDDEETEAEDFSSVEQEGSVDAEIYNEGGPDTGNRNKRQDTETDTDTDDDVSDDSNNSSATDSKSDDNNSDDSDSDNDSDDDSEPITEKNQSNETNAQHDVDKREANFEVPEIDINTTLIIKNEIPKLTKLIEEVETEKIKIKYPYYFKKIKGINKNSPLRYAENLKFIPKKSDGGTEFYDSRSQFECPEVDDDVDPIPEKLKNGENPTEGDSDEDSEESKAKGDKSFEIVKQPRLKGLGDKIDCFRAKYFGENPLDSPFFKEEIISNPEPIIALKFPTQQTIQEIKGEKTLESKINNVIDSPHKLGEDAQTNIFVLLDKLRGDQNSLQESLNRTNAELTSSLYTPQGTLATNGTLQASLYNDILKNMKYSLQTPETNTDLSTRFLESNIVRPNITYNYFQNKEEVTKLPPKLRKKRASTFVYEPYKIIRDSQVQDSKKTTTTSNISPLIKQLQSSRVADRVSRSNKDDKQVKPSQPNSRTYVDIGRKERTSPFNILNNNPDTTFVDVSVDNRRGEPRYELRPTNHKSEYTPVENNKAMSLEAYKSQTTTKKYEGNTTPRPIRGRQRFSLTTTPKPYYDVTQFIPKTSDIQNAAASNTVKNTVTNAASEAFTEKQIKKTEVSDEKNTDEDYEDEDEDEEDEEDDEEDIDDEEITTTTTTSTPRPSFRRKMKVTTTEKIPERTTEPQRLKQVTRFRNYKPDESTQIKLEITERPGVIANADEDDIVIPKYREKKKKSHTSTLVTDTKKYGEDDDDDMRKDEVDTLIGIKHDMRDYMPLYEKEEEGNEKLHRSRKNEGDDDENDEDSDDNDDEEDDEEDDDEDDNDENDDDDVDDNDEDEEEEERQVPEPEVTTPEPTKRSLVRTTDAPPTTVATQIRTTTPTVISHIVKPETKPIITRKKIEIHKELPVNKSSPHVTQFKQDIKEVEIIKEIPAVPKKKPTKNVEALNLYKDDDLAKAINDLGDVEIFSENLDLDNGPKHGGNYRKATKEDLKLLKPAVSSTNPLKDAEASQSENTKHVELDDYTPKRLHGGNLKSLSDIKRTRNSGRNSKLIELTEPPTRGMHGGNFKYGNKRRGDRKNEKLVELDDDRYEDNSSQQDDDYKPHSSGRERMHGGNYKSAKLVAPKDSTVDIKVKSSNNARKSAAVLLNSFAQAVPILTSTPGYIVDPSKRMYYYVEA